MLFWHIFWKIYQNKVLIVIWESSENQFGRPRKICRQNFWSFSENVPQPLEKILDPPLIKMTQELWFMNSAKHRPIKGFLTSSRKYSFIRWTSIVPDFTYFSSSGGVHNSYLHWQQRSCPDSGGCLDSAPRNRRRVWTKVSFKHNLLCRVMFTTESWLWQNQLIMRGYLARFF